ncbi:MAG: hypothetical protein AAGN82_11630 [Myxococcota bacterium]
MSEINTFFVLPPLLGVATALASCATEVDVVPPEPLPPEPVELPPDPCRDRDPTRDGCCDFSNCALLIQESGPVCVSRERNCFGLFNDYACPEGYVCIGDQEVTIDGACTYFGADVRDGGLGFCALADESE